MVVDFWEDLAAGLMREQVTLSLKTRVLRSVAWPLAKRCSQRQYTSRKTPNKI